MHPSIVLSLYWDEKKKKLTSGGIGYEFKI